MTKHTRTFTTCLAALGIAAGLAACGSTTTVSRSGGVVSKQINPSFPTSIGEARSSMEEMQNERRLFQRPVVVVAGGRDKGFTVAQTTGELQYMTTDEDQVAIVQVSPSFSASDADRLVRAVNSKFGANTMVDVIGISTGSLVARQAAAEGGLNINALFAVGAPDKSVSEVVFQRLDRMYSSSDFPVYGYIRLSDSLVNAQNTVPPGGNLWWLPAPALEYKHASAHRDARILADIGRRLRQRPEEPPFAEMPPAPIPGSAIATVPTTD